jgi:cytochrome c oxidase subunit 3
MLSGAISLVSYCHHHLVNNLSPVLIVFAVIYWWRDVIREAKGGDHTSRVQRGILIGFLLFLLSEIMLFVSLFWALFHSSLAPNVELAIWPPVGIQVISPWAIPLLGSCVLLASGFILTLGHHALILGSKYRSS